jgi:hypothetical protein
MLNVLSMMSKGDGMMHGIMHWGEEAAGHIAAVVGGVALMVIGLAMGVTMVLLPFGIVVGLLGVLLFVWGLVGHLEKRGHDTPSM